MVLLERDWGSGSMSAHLDRAAADLALAPSEERTERAAALRAAAAEAGVFAASIEPIYTGLALGELPAMTVPAMNLRGLTYDVARAAWRAAAALDAGPIIFELAPSEADVTLQRFDEYAAMVLAAATREGYEGPVFLQGDHFDIAEDTPASLERVQTLWAEASAAGTMQVDIDAAALADMEAADAARRQARNARATATMIAMIRDTSGDGVVIGGEVGEIGGSNTRPDDLRAFLDQVRAELPAGTTGLGKVSVQTGTRHGGVVTADGSTAEMPLDVELASRLSAIARDEYGLPGVVQHGASTLTLQQQGRLPDAGVIEVHLATGFQNSILDHPALPSELVERMKDELVGPVRHAEGGKHGAAVTSEQRFYQNRWQAWGRFKRSLWTLPEDVRAAIGATLEERFAELFTALGVAGRRDALSRIPRPR